MLFWPWEEHITLQVGEGFYTAYEGKWKFPLGNHVNKHVTKLSKFLQLFNVPVDLKRVLVILAAVQDDVRSAISSLTTEFPKLPLTFVGHSLGGALTYVSFSVSHVLGLSARWMWHLIVRMSLR